MADDKRIDPDEEMIEEEMLFEDDEDSNLVELTDEDGNVAQFEYLDTLEHKGESYVVFMAVQDDEEDEDEDEEGEVVILKIAQDDKGEDIYVTVEDEDIVQEVFDMFMENLGAEDED
ncbi:MAG: DUF1292 domain-containing protein [Eubacteriales bacterium]|nr:DUF1292 domain-containing protein [Eubacteriales bacterium]